MLTHILSPDTQAILLLCATFGQNRANEVQPLTLSEYNSLTSWLIERQLTPANLLEFDVKKQLQQPVGKLDSDRLAALLERGVLLSLAVEKWTNQGLWILGRSDAEYPKRLKQRLRHSAPAILYGVGNAKLLAQGGLAIVGSRDIDAEGLSYTELVSQNCAEAGMQVISGGARGVDTAAMLGALAAGGTVVGVLADSLAKAAVAGKYRPSIQAGRLTLISAFDPNAGFSVGNAMARNKYIYALADSTLAVSSSVGKGGTWAGAIEALDKIKDVPLLVRLEGSAPEGNRKLVEKGAIPFPQQPWNRQLPKLLAAAISEAKAAQEPSQTVPQQLSLLSLEEPSAPATNGAASDRKSSPKTIYEAVLPLILQHLDTPQNDKYLAQCLDVQLKQIQIWLKRAVEEGKIRKNLKPVTYQLKS